MVQMPGLPSRRTASRYLGIWGCLAICTFVAAWSLTRIVTRVNHPDFDPAKTEVQGIGILSPQGQQKTFQGEFPYVVRYKYDEAKSAAAITVSFIWGEETLLLNHVKACVANSRDFQGMDKDLKDLIASPVKENLKLVRLSNDLSCISLEEFGHLPGVDVTCTLDSFVRSETFAARSIYFRNVGPNSAVSSDLPAGCATRNERHSAVFTKWTLDASQLGDADNMTFSVAENRSMSRAEGFNDYFSVDKTPAPSFVQLASAREIAPDDTVELRWQWVSKESERDEIFVLIGALVAVGATLLLEAIRPFVEIIVGRHKRGGNSSN